MGLLENFNRSSGAVVALAADVHRPYQKKCILRMHKCFVLLRRGKKYSGQIGQLLSCLKYSRYSGLKEYVFIGMKEMPWNPWQKEDDRY